MNISPRILNRKLVRVLLAGMLLASAFATELSADVDIRIGGNVYGGGREGAVGTSYTTATDGTDAAAVTITDNNPVKVTDVVVNNGTIVGKVFGGGQEGRAYGGTEVEVNGGVMDGVFGAGDGSKALVFGHDQVTVKGGTISNNVYGGGNLANLIGSTNVILQGGTILGDVYGGSRVANIYGRSYVNIDGANAVSDLIIKTVYGGNDISGKIEPTTNANWAWATSVTLPFAPGVATVNDSWNAFILSTPSASKNIFVGKVYGGGNGKYDYTLTDFNGGELDLTAYADAKPTIDRTYLEIKGGTFGYLFGGGNNATVVKNTVISLNDSEENISLAQIPADRIAAMDLNDDMFIAGATDDVKTVSYQFERVFGGNDQAPMDIRPTWNLVKASINNLYSGGNAGAMTYYKEDNTDPDNILKEGGIILPLTSADLTVNNAYGGCRMADVNPDNKTFRAETFGGVQFPADYPARVLVTAGTINNVYGGNDISGSVKGGAALEILGDIQQDVYGGGNGSYIYTDKDAASDLYYAGNLPSGFTNAESVAALNEFRPHTDRSYIHVAGTSTSTTNINGSLYGSGNSATVTDAIKLQLGQYTEIENVFLGSNGLHMVQESTLQGYADHTNTSTLDLTNSGIFNTYMLGAAVDCMPTYDFDADYPEEYSSSVAGSLAKIHSFFGGGNVGSMLSEDLFDISFKNPVIIEKKLVGGCNNAFVIASSYNARHEGGFTGAANAEGGNKIRMDVDGVVFTSPESGAANGEQGNIFGGCFNSGYITGNVVIKIGEDIIPGDFFTETNTRDSYLTDESYLFKTPLCVFGGGFGVNTTINGNTTIDIYDNGSALKVYGGGYQGKIAGNTNINLTAGNVGIIYGGGFEGPVTGNTRVNLDGGTVYSSFGGACNADIAGSALTYVGAKADGDMTTVTKSIFGGNDFGGSISGTNTFTVRSGLDGMVYNPDESDDTPNVLDASAYVEYVKGYVGEYIYGGNRGSYDYTNTELSGHLKVKDGKSQYPYLVNSFVNFRPSDHLSEDVSIERIFGAGLGKTRGTEDDSYQDRMQDRSYVLIDIPSNVQNFKTTDIYGAGAESGLGMRLSQADAAADPESVSAVVDLIRGTVNNVYGASYKEGITRRTVVNVPVGSTIHAKNLFGGGYGISLDKPCDVFEANINYSSDDAIVGGYRSGIYGGNNNMRRTLYSKVNINSPVWYDEAKASLATVYGAGYGKDTWSQYTEVNLNDGARLYEVYGGGNNGKVLNKATVDAWKTAEGDNLYLGLGGYTDNGLADPIVREVIVGDRKIKNNSTVYINKGAVVSGYMYNGSLSGAYAYGGGLGYDAVVSGSTYVGLHGGRVVKDLYAGGTYGGVRNLYGTSTTFTAETNAFIEGGTVRNVYGGGWEGDVGYARFDSTKVGSAVILEDIPAVSNVTIGILKEEAEARGLIASGEYGFYKGVPTVERNAYSGGEGGAIFGEAHLTINNGYIGYTYHGADYDTDESTRKEDIAATVFDERYVEKLDDETWNGDGTGRLKDSGNAFGGGYVDDSSVDYTFVKMYGGWVRNSLYGGGEIATIGRGDNRDSDDEVVNIFKPGKTMVELYDGHVLHDVFAGGKGYNNLNEIGKRNTNGYVFGKTEARIYGGVVGTADGVKKGYGNVFGGGNIGFVYTATGTKAEADNVANNITKGYYYNSGILTEDCKVVIAPSCRVMGNSSVTVNGNTYNAASYNATTGIYTPAAFVPIDDLKTIESKVDGRWAVLDTSGVRIYNAVFAGGNITRGSDLLYAEAITVYGNATASLIDAFCLDMIEVGSDEIGGLYGDGNLTFVDGYRELNVTNYGTDYYALMQEIPYDAYINLNDRQRAYFQVKYVNKTNPADVKTEEQYNSLPEEQQALYEPKGECTIFAGRMLNTIQRADFCGIFGSRIVLKGAQDRVPEKIDYTNYTINRLGELSLNESMVGSTSHGNYFGIYNIVHYLGALTSDVEFDTPRYYKETKDGGAVVDSKTYRQFKSEHEHERNRNNAYSRNEVALASGVYLELTRELYKNYVGEEKEYGPVTGIIELNLIAASTGEGGGYVYAKNIHGAQSPSTLTQLTLAAANQGAITQKSYQYAETSTLSTMESSGNFVTSNPDLSIIDDCFPVLNNFHPEGSDGVSPAHFWYLRGYYYVYNQEISAYTGSAQSYSETVNIPLTILAQGNGRLFIEDIKSSKYANAETFPFKQGSTTERADKVICGGKTYYANDPISYWDWSLLSDTEKGYFVDESYVCIRDIDVTNGGTTTRYSEGQILQKSEYDALSAAESSLSIVPVEYDDEEDLSLITFSKMFRPTNAMSHITGHALAVSVDNPQVWDEYYTSRDNNRLHNQTGNDGYLLGPTYRLISTGISENGVVFGQKEYSVSRLLDATTVQKYEGELKSVIYTDGNLNQGYQTQAEFEPAYMYIGSNNYYTITIPDPEGSGNDQTVQVVKRSTIPESYFNTYVPAADQSQFVKAYLCKQTTKINDHLILSNGVVYTRDELLEYAAAGSVSYVDDDNDLTTNPEDVIFTHFPEAYYCTTSGYYGGIKFLPGKNYEATDWAALEPSERSNFEFNYDALDVLLDPEYKGRISYYDDPVTLHDTDHPDSLYSAKQYVDYEALYTGTARSLKTISGSSLSVEPGVTVLTRSDFETLLNEKRHYTPVNVNFSDIPVGGTMDVYIVKAEFGNQGRVYTPGTTLVEKELTNLFGSNDEEKNKYISTLTLTRPVGNIGPAKYYYCFEEYTQSSLVDAESNPITITPINSSSYSVGQVGSLISETDYSLLPNEQVDFNVIADVPREKSSLYVSRDCDIYDYSQDRIVTVVYRYSFAETDMEGNTVENISERHVLNIRVKFESGVPTIADLQEPPIILPGTIVSLNVPTVEEGAFEVLGGAWEVYPNQSDAHAHKNGMPYDVSTTPMYWYQNDWYVSYYAETYLGRTYSNAVPIAVANYHDIDKVMADNTHHLYVDHPDVKRNSKIYIDRATSTSDNTKTKLDLLYDLFNLSLQPMNDDPDYYYEGDNSTVGKDNVYGKLKAKHTALNSHVNKLENLEFILRSDVTTNHSSWTPIGDATDCFGGNIHGDGYTVTGIDHSLFGNLCGSVFNLGVRGSIDGAGIADNGGYAENTWVINDVTDKNLSGRNAVMGTGIAVNSYYNDDATESAANRYSTGGTAIKKSLQEFMSGEVAYNLNGFYLKKRWSDAKYTAAADGLESYSYYTIDPVTDKPVNHTGYYSGSDGDWNENNSFASGKYVEEYYAYPDFIYAGGSVAISTDERHDLTNDKFYPIYPDDYIFFGQELSFGFYGASHDDQPASIDKNDNKRIDLSADGNRVYRAPGYYGSSVKDMAWFNRYARFRDTYKENDFYKELTAIDFTGYNDSGIAEATATRNSQESFFYPVLDYEGLVNYYTDGITRNLLVYADQTNDAASHDIIASRLFEPEFSISNSSYGTIDEVASTLIGQVKGHLVSLNVSGDSREYKSHYNHFLVDRQNFNAPIAYQYDDDHYMWYQRKPDGATDRYIENLKDGWETISLPFTADLVTTQTKGEITHFYSGSTTGHEYWLRELGSVTTKKDADDNDVITGVFASPAAGSEDKTVTNQYLWDTYYSKYDRMDANEDLYKHYEGESVASKDYYHHDREYENYPLFTAGKPYLIGFPGITYYEFDLSGTFVPQNTIQSIGKIDKQVITFVSVDKAPIAVSDTEYTTNSSAVSDGGSTDANYTFRTSYQTQNLAVNGGYLLNSADASHPSSKFVKNAEATSTVPFRPYFTYSSGGGAPKRAGTRADVLLIGYAGDDSDPIAEMVTNHGLYIYSEGMNICIESTLEQPADVTITTTSGRTLKRLTVQPGTKETVPVNNRGVYIVNRQKVAVTRR